MKNSFLRLGSSAPSVRRAVAPLIVLASLLCGGCFSIYGPKDYTVRVFDAETGQPIVGAETRENCLRVMFLLNNPDQPAPACTDGEGTSVIHGTTFSPRRFEARAKGYMSASTDEAKEIAPSGNIELWLWREPAPILTVVVPDSFHGFIKLNMKPGAEHAPATSGQREFVFQVPAQGDAEWRAPPVFDGGILLPLEGFFELAETIRLKFVSENGEPLARVREVYLEHGKLVSRVVMVDGKLVDRVWPNRASPPPPPEPLPARGLYLINSLGTHYSHPAGTIWFIGSPEEAATAYTKFYTATRRPFPKNYELDNKAFAAAFTPSGELTSARTKK
jgi:hypothetical protein